MSHQLPLEGKAVLVTGATQGLGAAIARESAHQGASAVMVAGRDAGRGETMVAELSASGCQAAYYAGDLSKKEHARNVVRSTIDAFGRVDCVVNSAGTTDRAGLLDTEDWLLDKHLSTNLKAPFFVMQEAIGHMLDRSIAGNIVNVITLSAHGGQPFLTPYVAAKAGLAGLTKNVAFAFRKHGIRVNGLNIGWTATDGENAMQVDSDGSGADWLERASKAAPMGKLGQVEEIAEFVAFLLSPRSGVVTGSLIDWDQNVIGAYE